MCSGSFLMVYNVCPWNRMIKSSMKQLTTKLSIITQYLTQHKYRLYPWQLYLQYASYVFLWLPIGVMDNTYQRQLVPKKTLNQDILRPEKAVSKTNPTFQVGTI